MSFYEWLDEIEVYSSRRERFHDEVETADPVRLEKWLKTAWDLGVAAGRKAVEDELK